MTKPPSTESALSKPLQASKRAFSVFEKSILILLFGVFGLLFLRGWCQCYHRNRGKAEVISYPSLNNFLHDETALQKAAQHLFRNHNYAQALVLYQRLLSQGLANVGLFRALGDCFSKLGYSAKAENSYLSALALEPQNAKAAVALARHYLSQNQFNKAFSFLLSFWHTYPEKEPLIKSQLVTMRHQIDQTLASTTPTSPTLSLIAPIGGHHYWPIRFQSPTPTNSDRRERHSLVFLVDTGATTLTMPTAFVNRYYPEAIRTAHSHPLTLADRRVIPGFISIIPKLRMGPFTVFNVETTFCDTCSALIGKSLLKNFKMTIQPKGGVEVLTLTQVEPPKPSEPQSKVWMGKIEENKR